MADVDPADKEQLGSVFVPNPNVKKATGPRRRFIPARTKYSGKDIIYLPAQLAGSLDHIKNPLLARRAMPHCEGAEGCPYPVTSYIRLPGTPREATQPACAEHTKGIQKWHASRGIDGLTVISATPKATKAYGVMKAKMHEEKLLYGASALLSGGLPMEEALNFGISGPAGRPKHNREKPQNVSLGGAPTMNDEEVKDYEAGRRKTRRESGTTVYDLVKTTEVKKGKHTVNNQNLPLGEGTGDIDKVVRMRKAGDPGWEAEAKRLNIHASLLEPFVPYSGKATGVRKEGVIPVAQHRLVPSKERLTKAIEEVGAEHAESRAELEAQNIQAAKQRKIESRKRGLELGASEARGIEGPK